MRDSAVTRAAAYARLFQTPADLFRYARLRRLQRQHRDGPAVQLRLKALGGRAVLCRPGQDVWTLKHTFIEQFHLPPIELPHEATIVDLGSNVGYTVAHFAHRYPGARIIGVELDRANFDLAEINTRGFGDRISLVHAAVWVTDGEVAYEGVDADAFRVVPGAAGGGRRVPAKRLETLLDEHGVDRVDYLKMDVEGAEADLLAAPLDWADRVQAMKIELHPPASAGVCCDALVARGFECEIDDRHWNTIVAVRAGALRGPRRHATGDV